MSGIPDIVLTEDYQAFKILRFVHLNNLATSIEEAFRNYSSNNLDQIAADIFGEYDYNNDGLPSREVPLFDEVALKTEVQSIVAAWTFESKITFEDTVTFESIVSASGQPRVRTYLNTTSQSIADSSEVSILFNADDYDIGSLHDTGINPSRITIGTGNSGAYQFEGQVTFAANATGLRKLLLYKNGSKVAEVKEFSPNASEETVLNISFQNQVSAGDYYELKAYQSSGGSLNVVFGQFKTFLCAMKVW